MKNNLKIFIIFIVSIFLIACSQIQKQESSSTPYSKFALKAGNNITGTTINEKNAYPGHTIIAYPRKDWILIDMNGTIVKKGNGSIPVISFGNYIIEYLRDKKGTNYLIKYDWDFNQIWKKNIPNVHHEIFQDDDNSLYIVANEIKKYNGRDVKFDIVLHLDKEGHTLSKWKTYDYLSELKKHHNNTQLDLPVGEEVNLMDYDYYHLNSFQALPKTNHTNKIFQKGNWLLSFHVVDLVLILDEDTKNVEWTWGPGNLSGQHTPRMLADGNILIFDNGLETKTRKRGFTRIIELNPITKKIVWEYKGYPPESFFTNVIGSAQRLPNGNTLISAGLQGGAFEITKEGNIVWEWHSPIIDEIRKPVYRATRI